MVCHWGQNLVQTVLKFWPCGWYWQKVIYLWFTVKHNFIEKSFKEKSTLFSQNQRVAMGMLWPPQKIKRAESQMSLPNFNSDSLLVCTVSTVFNWISIWTWTRCKLKENFILIFQWLKTEYLWERYGWKTYGRKNY